MAGSHYRRDMVIDRRIALVAGTLEDAVFDGIERLGEVPGSSSSKR
jgi:hypothetical protein